MRVCAREGTGEGEGKEMGQGKGRERWARWGLPQASDRDFLFLLFSVSFSLLFFVTILF